jgi:hypothetical protein
MNAPDFERVLEQGRAVQHRFPALGLVAVGGTAAALHCRHRFSLDVDSITPRLREQFAEVSEALGQWEGWTTNRLNPPVLILGERGGVELGLRQQRREAPLRTVEVAGLLVPTAEEMLRIKAFLVAGRRATRDWVDVAALGEHLGVAPALEALACLNLLYPEAGSQTMVTRFAEACEGEPLDLALTPLASYKGLLTPFTDWAYVASACRRLGRELLKRELSNALPSSLDQGFFQETAS